MRNETSPVLVLHTLTAFRSKSFSFSYKTNHASMFVQKAKKGIKQPLNVYEISLVKSETIRATNYSFRSNIHRLTVEKQTSFEHFFDDTRTHINRIKSLLLDKHTTR